MTEAIIQLTNFKEHKQKIKRVKGIARDFIRHHSVLRDNCTLELSEKEGNLKIKSSDLSLSKEELETMLETLITRIKKDNLIGDNVILYKSKLKPVENSTHEVIEESTEKEELISEIAELKELLAIEDEENKTLKQLLDESKVVKKSLLDQRRSLQVIIFSLTFNYLKSKEKELLDFSNYLNRLADREIIDYKLKSLIQGKVFSMSTYLSNESLLPEEFNDDESIEDLIELAAIPWEETEIHKKLFEEYKKAKEAEDYLSCNNYVPEAILATFDRKKNQEIIKNYESEKRKHEKIKELKKIIDIKRETYELLSEIREEILERIENPVIIPLMFQYKDSSVKIYTPISEKLCGSYFDNQLYQHIYETTLKAFEGGFVRGFSCDLINGIKTFTLTFANRNISEEHVRIEKLFKETMIKHAVFYDYLRAGAKLEFNFIGKDYSDS